MITNKILCVPNKVLKFKDYSGGTQSSKISLTFTYEFVQTHVSCFNWSAERHRALRLRQPGYRNTHANHIRYAYPSIDDARRAVRDRHIGVDVRVGPLAEEVAQLAAQVGNAGRPADEQWAAIVSVVLVVDARCVIDLT